MGESLVFQARYRTPGMPCFVELTGTNTCRCCSGKERGTANRILSSEINDRDVNKRWSFI